MATLEEQMKKVQDKIEGLQEEIKAVKLLPEGHLERPLLMELNKQLTELNKQLSVLQERLLLKERAASQPQAAPIGITVALPRMDEDRQVVLRPVQQKEFRDSADFDTWLNKLELQGLEDEDGILVTSFDELKAGCTYTGVLRPSSGALSSLSGADRARINAAEQEFQEGLIPLVAKEEGVSPDQVTLLPEARQVFEELDGHQTAVLELDAVLYVQKPGQQDCVWLGSHKLRARGFQPVGELVEAANDMEAYVKDPMKYPATKSFKGCNNFKKAFYAEYYEVPHGIKYQRFKEKCIKSGVTLVKKSGSGLVKARLV